MAKTVPAAILIVDDEPSMRELLAQQLSTEYSSCVTAHSAFDALNKIKRSVGPVHGAASP